MDMDVIYDDGDVLALIPSPFTYFLLKKSFCFTYHYRK